MAEVSSVTAAVANAFAGVASSVGSTSLGRMVAGLDATANNLIEGVVSPTARRLVRTRGYQYRNNSHTNVATVLTPQQLQIAKTSSDSRIIKIQRDCVNLLTRACDASDALGNVHPSFGDKGAVHLRITLPVPTSAPIGGFERRGADEAAGTPSPPGGIAQNTTAGQPRAPPSAASGSGSSSVSDDSGDEDDEDEEARFAALFGLREPDPQFTADLVLGYESAAQDEETGAMRDTSSSRDTTDIEGWNFHHSDSDGNVSDASAGGAAAAAAAAQAPAAPAHSSVGHAGQRSPLSSQASRGQDSDSAGGDESALGQFGRALQRARRARRAVPSLPRAPRPDFRKYLASRPRCPRLFREWFEAGVAYGFFTRLASAANPTGARDVYVLDVTIPTDVYVTCIETADIMLGEDKPARNLHLQKTLRKLRKSVSKSVGQHGYVYLTTVTALVSSAALLDIGDTGKQHCHILGYTGEQQVFSDFFADTGLESAIDDLKVAKESAGHPTERIVHAMPAPEVKGRLNETLVLYETAAFGEYELKEKKRVVGAVPVGVDLLGKAAPNDHTDPLSYVSAIYRHLGDSDTAVAEGTPYEYVIHLDRSERVKMSKVHERVWNDMIHDHCQDFKEYLTHPETRFDYDFLEDGKPGSYSRESYLNWLEKQLADEQFYAGDGMAELLKHTGGAQEHMAQLRASAACKKGEDSSRARFVISPGVMGSEGLHQARISPMIRALEALHAACYNHTNLKGLTEETKRIRFAEFLMAVPKGAIVFGTDKSKNDACFREPVWRKCIEYLAKMHEIFDDHVVTRAYVYSPNEHKTKSAFPEGTIDLKYWMVKLTPLLAFLLSGIGPTGFFNRLESVAENGAAVLEIYGEEAYKKWRFCERNAAPSTHPAWRKHPRPHAADVVDWAPLAPKMVSCVGNENAKDIPAGQIFTHHMGANEGDDQVHAILPPEGAEWTDISIRETIMQYTATLSRTTGFIFEPAMTADEYDMVGRNSIFEMLSAWVGLPHGKAEKYEVAVIVPKILKALRKIPHCSISSQHVVIRDQHEEAIDVQRDATFWALALTKYYSLAIINKESLGVRGLFLAHGDYAFEKLAGLVGQRAANNHATVYGDRDPEKRGLEEASATTFEYCGTLRESAHDAIHSVRIERVARVCCAAWRSDLPDLARLPKDQVIASLLAFDATSMSIEVTDNHVADPMSFWELFDEVGCILPPLVAHATQNHKKIACLYRNPRMVANSEQTVLLARQLASTKPNSTTDKDSGSGNAAKTGKTGGKGGGNKKDAGGSSGAPASDSSGDGNAKDGKPKAGKGKGKSGTTDSSGKGRSGGKPSQGKGKGKLGKGAPEPKLDDAGSDGSSGKGKGSRMPRPSAGKSSSNDSWWRTAESWYKKER